MKGGDVVREVLDRVAPGVDGDEDRLHRLSRRAEKIYGRGDQEHDENFAKTGVPEIFGRQRGRIT
jgi:hypothetical protein